MIILVALIDIQIPAPTLVFFQGCILIAQMDVIGGENWYAKNMKFIETTPYTQNFELFGMDNKNFMLNSGSYLIFQVLILCDFLIKMLVRKICAKFADTKGARAIGANLYTKNASRRLFNSYVKLFMESYFDLCFCAMLNLIAFMEAKNKGVFIVGRDNIICSILTVFYLPMLVIFPVWIFFTIRSNLTTLSLKITNERIGVLYEGLKEKSPYFNVMFLIRRLVTASVLIFWA